MNEVNLLNGFLESSARFGDRPALTLSNQTLTYAELTLDAARIAGTISREQTTDHPYVGILAQRSLSAYAGILGTLMAGGTYVPLNPDFPLVRTEAMCRLSSTQILIVGPEALDASRKLLTRLARPLVVLMPQMQQLPSWTENFPWHRFVTSNQLAETMGDTPPSSPGEFVYLLFTSGSTGEPKGVPVSHANVHSYVQFICNRYQVTENDRFSHTFDLTFDLSVHDMFVCWEQGANLCCPSGPAVVSLAKYIRDHELTMWFSVPSTAGRMLDLKLLRPGIFSSLRTSLFCGEALPAAYAETWQEAAPQSILENLYGPTEATIAICQYRWDPDSSPHECRDGVVPIGRPFNGQRTCVVDSEGLVAPPGEEGELCLTGTQVTGGYLNNPEKTRSQFVKLSGQGDVIWYRTGDLVREETTGRMCYLGRIDSQVKIRGYRVELQEIEHFLRQELKTQTVVAVPWGVRHGSAEGVVAFVCGGDPDDRKPVLARCRDHLPAYMVPRELRFVNELPLNPNGKIDRKRLVATLEAE